MTLRPPHPRLIVVTVFGHSQCFHWHVIWAVSLQVIWYDTRRILYIILTAKMGASAQDLNSYWQTGEIEKNWAKQQESGAVCKSVIGWAAPRAREGITGSWTLKTLNPDSQRKWLCILHSAFIKHQWAELLLCIHGNWSFLIRSHAGNRFYTLNYLSGARPSPFSL